MRCKRFAGMTYLENIAKPDIKRFVADDILGNTITTEKKSRNNAKPQIVVAIND